MLDENASHTPESGAHSSAVPAAFRQPLPVSYGLTKGGQPKQPQRPDTLAQMLATHFATRYPRVLVVDHDSQSDASGWRGR